MAQKTVAVDGAGTLMAQKAVVAAPVRSVLNLSITQKSSFYQPVFTDKETQAKAGWLSYARSGVREGQQREDLGFLTSRYSRAHSEGRSSTGRRVRGPDPYWEHTLLEAEAEVGTARNDG